MYDMVDVSQSGRPLEELYNDPGAIVTVAMTKGI